jgi:hypothetical protein
MLYIPNVCIVNMVVIDSKCDISLNALAVLIRLDQARYKERERAKAILGRFTRLTKMNSFFSSTGVEPPPLLPDDLFGLKL